MNFIAIRSKGEIEAAALVLMGASTKRGEAGKIGLFGTGAKYALAVLLRRKVPIRIWSGLSEVSLETEPVRLRGQEFERLVVVAEGRRHETSVTLEIGPTWDLWMALRELVANAVDEGMMGLSEGLLETFRPEAGSTLILVGKDEAVAEAWKRSDELVRISQEPILSTEHGKLYPRLGPDAVRIYKNGVLYGKYEDRTALWDYDLPAAPVTEDRRIQYWDAQRLAAKLVAGSRERMREVLEFVAGKSEGRKFEGGFIDSYDKPDPGWVELVGDRPVATCEEYLYWERDIRDLSMNVLVLPGDWVESLQRFHKDKVRSIGDALRRSVAADLAPVKDRSDKSALRRALDVMKRAGLEITVPVEVVSFRDDAILGRWDEKAQKILIAKKILADGPGMVLEVLIEERAHQVSGCADMTRGLQTFLCRDIVRLLRKRYAL